VLDLDSIPEGHFMWPAFVAQHGADFKKILEKGGLVLFNAAGAKGKTTTRVDGVKQVLLQYPIAIGWK
jgi:hypothetical protein